MSPVSAVSDDVSVIVVGASLPAYVLATQLYAVQHRRITLVYDRPNVYTEGVAHICARRVADLAQGADDAVAEAHREGARQVVLVAATASAVLALRDVTLPPSDRCLVPPLDALERADAWLIASSPNAKACERPGIRPMPRQIIDRHEGRRSAAWPDHAALAVDEVEPLSVRRLLRGRDLASRDVDRLIADVTLEDDHRFEIYSAAAVSAESLRIVGGVAEAPDRVTVVATGRPLAFDLRLGAPMRPFALKTVTDPREHGALAQAFVDWCQACRFTGAAELWLDASNAHGRDGLLVVAMTPYLDNVLALDQAAQGEMAQALMGLCGAIMPTHAPTRPACVALTQGVRPALRALDDALRREVLAADRIVDVTRSARNGTWRRRRWLWQADRFFARRQRTARRREV